jgi:cell division transport system permease protein
MSASGGKGGAAVKAGTGATAPRRSIRGKTNAWLDHHRKVAYESLSSLLRDWMTSLMTWLVIGIAIALPVLLFVMLVNVGEIGEDWDGDPRISLYLKQGVSEADGRSLGTRLRQDADIESVLYISANEALSEFRALSGFGDVMNALDKNPLPAVLELKPSNADVGELRLKVAMLARNELVDTVKFDLEWIERLFAMLLLGERLVMSLGLVLALGVLLVIGNTIRLAIENRRSEIEIVKLVGGTDSFVRRPFLYLGFWYGLGGSVLAWVLVQASLLFLAGPVEVLAQSYRDDFALTGLNAASTAIIFGGGTILGVFGALLAVGRHLSEIEPK